MAISSVGWNGRWICEIYMSRGAGGSSGGTREIVSYRLSFTWYMNNSDLRWRRSIVVVGRRRHRKVVFDILEVACVVLSRRLYSDHNTYIDLGTFDTYA